MGSKRWAPICVAAMFLFSSTAVLARDHDHGRGHNEDNKAWHGHGHGNDGRDAHARDRGHRDRYYGEHERVELRQWYRNHYNNLPPGLAKRDRLPPGLERQLVVRGTLPPGLRRRIEPCPREVVRFLPPPPPGYEHVVIGANIVLVNRHSWMVLDVFHLSLN